VSAPPGVVPGQRRCADRPQGLGIGRRGSSVIPWRRLSDLCLSTHDREPCRSPTVPLFPKNSQLLDQLFSDLVQSRFPSSRRQGAR
jgi:hypothetical protein